jgi:transposase
VILRWSKEREVKWHYRKRGREAEIMAAQGIELDRSTLAGWVGQAAALLDPIVTRIREEGLQAGKLYVDDTPVPMLVPGKGKTAQARLWAYVVDDRPSGATTPALVWYRFTPDCSGIHPQTKPPRDCRRPFGLNYAAMGVSSSMA